MYKRQAFLDCVDAVLGEHFAEVEPGTGKPKVEKIRHIFDWGDIQHVAPLHNFAHPRVGGLQFFPELRLSDQDDGKEPVQPVLQFPEPLEAFQSMPVQVVSLFDDDAMMRPGTCLLYTSRCV